jgi:tetratricopeptide (TPR) repeat protein
LLIATFLSFFPVIHDASAQSVTVSFNKGRKLFEQGKLRAAYKVLSETAKKYPGHQPSQILLGRILFKSGKISAAAKRFRKVSPDSITPDFAYEYGIVMFSVKQCERAQAGFSRVPSNSKLAPLANFYRGICYVREQDWQRASKALLKARGLPGNLEQTRRQALSQVQRQMRAERSGNVGSSNPYIIVPSPPPPVPYQEQIPVDQAPLPPDNRPPPPPPPPPTGFQSSYTPALVYTQVSRSEDMHGTGINDSQIKKSELKLGVKSKYLAEPRSFGAQPYFSFGFDLNQISTDTKGTKITYIAYENDPTTIIEQQSGNTDVSATALEVKLSPEVGYPVTDTIDVSGTYTLKETYPDMKADKKSTSMGPSGIFDYSGEIVNLKLSGSMTDSVKEGKPVKTDTVVGGQLTKDFENTSVLASFQQTESKSALPVVAGPMEPSAFFGTTTVITANGTKNWETVSMTAGVTNITYNTGSPLVIKILEDQRTVLELSGNKSFDFGGSLTFTVQQATLAAYKKAFDDKTASADPAAPKQKVFVKGDGTEQTFLTVFKLTPISWITGSLSYKYVTGTYNQSNADYQKEFISSTADLVTEFTMVVSVSKTF